MHKVSTGTSTADFPYQKGSRHRTKASLAAGEEPTISCKAILLARPRSQEQLASSREVWDHAGKDQRLRRPPYHQSMSLRLPMTSTTPTATTPCSVVAPAVSASSLSTAPPKQKQLVVTKKSKRKKKRLSTTGETANGHPGSSSASARQAHLRAENRLARISLCIVWLFIFCHVWKLVPTIYELVLPADDERRSQWPQWLSIVNDVSHTLIVFNSAVNFLIYTIL